MITVFRQLSTHSRGRSYTYITVRCSRRLSTFQPQSAICVMRDRAPMSRLSLLYYELLSTHFTRFIIIMFIVMFIIIMYISTIIIIITTYCYCYYKWLLLC
jgi:hypothetical protein